MKKILSFLCPFILFACNKELDSNNRLTASSADALGTVTCQTLSVTDYHTECWYTEGPFNESQCKQVPVTSNYTVCFESGNPSPVSTYWGGGASNPTPATQSSPPPPPVINVQPHFAYMCGTYKWKKIGDAHYAQVKNVGVTIKRPDNSIQTVSLGSSGPLRNTLLRRPLPTMRLMRYGTTL